MISNIAVLGAGTWGIALARMLTNCGHIITLWSAIQDEIDFLSTFRKHKNLPEMVIPDATQFTKSVEEACREKDILLIAVPSIYVRSTIKAAAPYVPNGQIIVNVAKGLEPNTLYTMTQVIRDELEKMNKYCSLVALSGPTHAEEVARDVPTMIVSACDDLKVAQKVQDLFMNSCLRVYTNPDVEGVELCGAIKM